MTISLTCLCGKVLIADASLAGRSAVCPSCGYMNTIPAPLALESPPEPPVVIPVDEVEEVEEIEGEIPEVEVELHVPPWEAKKPPPLPGEATPTTTKKLRPDVKEDDNDPDTTDFAGKLAAAEALGWGYVGALRLPEPATCLAYGPGGAWGLVDQDDDILILNMQKGKRIDRFRKHDAPVSCLALSPEGTYALTGDESGDIIRWELNNHKRRLLLEEHDSPITALTLSHSAEMAASGDRRGTVVLWNLAKRTTRALADADWSERITALAFSPDGAVLVAGGSKGRVGAWSVRSGRRLFRCEFPEPIGSLRFSFKGDVLMAAAKPRGVGAACHPTVYRIDIDGRDADECFAPPTAPSVIPHCTVLDHGAKRLLVAGQPVETAVRFLKGDCRLEVWSLAPPKLLHVFPDLKGEVVALAITPGNNRVAALLAKPLLQVFTLPDR